MSINAAELVKKIQSGECWYTGKNKPDKMGPKKDKVGKKTPKTDVVVEDSTQVVDDNIDTEVHDDSGEKSGEKSVVAEKEEEVVKISKKELHALRQIAKRYVPSDTDSEEQEREPPVKKAKKR